MRVFALFVLILLATRPALAQQQQQPDPAFLQRALTAMQAQRNQAMDAAAVQQARADGLTDDLSKANARIKELEPKPNPAAEPDKK